MIHYHSPVFLPSQGFKTKLPQSHTQNRQNHSETFAGFFCWYCVIPVIPLLPLLDPKLPKASCYARPVDGAMAALAEDFDLGFFESNQHPCIRYWWSFFSTLLYKNLHLKIPIYCVLDRYTRVCRCVHPITCIRTHWSGGSSLFRKSSKRSATTLRVDNRLSGLKVEHRNANTGLKMANRKNATKLQHTKSSRIFACRLEWHKYHSSVLGCRFQDSIHLALECQAVW